MALCPECALNVSTPVHSSTRDRCAYVVDLTLYPVESSVVAVWGRRFKPSNPNHLLK